MTILVALSVVILALIGAVLFYMNKAKQKEAEIAEVVEMMTFEREQVEQEFQDLNYELFGLHCQYKKRFTL